MNIKTIFNLLFGCLISFAVSAQSIDSSSETRIILDNSEIELSIPSVNQVAIIDGNLNDDIWRNALKVSLNYETAPSENITPDVETIVYLAEDGENLYVAFLAQDPYPSKIRAFYRDRDQVSDDDFVAITLDTYNDSTRAYQFYVNALGVQKDSVINDERENDSWDAIWDSASEITQQGYTVEMAIPLSVLSFAATSEQTWGVNLWRVRPRDKRQQIQLNPDDRSNACSLCQLKKFSGFKHAEPTNKLLVIPSLTSSYRQERIQGAQSENFGDWQKAESNQELGIDVEWGINVNSTLNLTYNPDFSQIEADSSQLTVNNQYALFYREKRNFFLEGADYFDSPMSAIYTRSIADPDYGIKYTTKTDGHTIGLIAGRDAVTNLVTPNQYHTASAIEQLTETNSNGDASALKNDFFVSRYSYDLGGASNVGAIATYRSAPGYDNTVVGADSKYRFNDQDSITMQVLSSETRSTAEQTSLTDQAYYLSFIHDERDWYSFARYMSVGKDFRADLGFFNRFSHAKLVVGGGYIWYGETTDLFNRMVLSGDWDISKDEEGRTLEEEFEMYLTLEGPMQSRLRVGGGQRDNLNSTTAINDGGESYRLDTNYAEKFTRLDFQITPISGLFAELGLTIGDQIDHANNQLGDSQRLDFSMAYNINRHLELSLDYTNSTLDVNDGELFDAQILDFKVNYQFDAKTALRLTLQQSQVDKAPSLYKYKDVQANEDAQALQLLFSYKFNPKTVAFVGYADAGFTDDNTTELTKSERNLFMKFSYAF